MKAQAFGHKIIHQFAFSTLLSTDMQYNNAEKISILTK